MHNPCALIQSNFTLSLCYLQTFQLTISPALSNVASWTIAARAETFNLPYTKPLLHLLVHNVSYSCKAFALNLQRALKSLGSQYDIILEVYQYP